MKCVHYSSKAEMIFCAIVTEEMYRVNEGSTMTRLAHLLCDSQCHLENYCNATLPLRILQ